MSTKRKKRIDVTKNWLRERLRSPRACDPASFRAVRRQSRKHGSRGVLLTFCCPRGSWMPRARRCRRSMVVQSLARPRKRRA